MNKKKRKKKVCVKEKGKIKKKKGKKENNMNSVSGRVSSYARIFDIATVPLKL